LNKEADTTLHIHHLSHKSQSSMYNTVLYSTAVVYQ